MRGLRVADAASLMHLDEGLVRAPLGSRLAARFARLGLGEEIPELHGGAQIAAAALELLPMDDEARIELSHSLRNMLVARPSGGRSG